MNKVTIEIDDELNDMISMISKKTCDPINHIIISLLEMGLNSCLNTGLSATISAQGDNGDLIN